MMPKSSTLESNCQGCDDDGEREWFETLKGKMPKDYYNDCASDDSLGDRRLLDASKRSTSSRTTSGATYATNGSDSASSQNLKDNSDDHSKKKKSKKKKGKDRDRELNKKKKKKKTKEKKELTADDDDDNVTTVTESDEKLVDELCCVLSKTLSTAPKTKAFLTLLKEHSTNDALKSQTHPRGDSLYESLSSPEPSVCGSFTSNVSTLSFMHKVTPNTRVQWTRVDPPSIASVSYVPSERGHLNKISVKNREDIQSPYHSIATLKRSNLLSSSRLMINADGQSPREMSPPATPSASPSCSSDKDFEETAFDRHENLAMSESSPEELFMALPLEFRSYLLGLHSEELQNSKQSSRESDQKEMLLMQYDSKKIPTETYRDRDELSVVSDLTGMTGATGRVSTALLKPLGSNSLDESSDVSDDSDEESQSSGPRLQSSLSVVSQSRRPRRSSMVSQKLVQSKQVRFDWVYVREYNTVLDLNPSVTDGAAIAIGWKVIHESRASVESTSGNRHRRQGDALMLSTHTREAILLKSGYSKKDIEGAQKRILKAQNQRRRTAHKVRVESVEFALERVGKRFRDLLKRSNSNSRISG